MRENTRKEQKEEEVEEKGNQLRICGWSICTHTHRQTWKKKNKSNKLRIIANKSDTHCSWNVYIYRLKIFYFVRGERAKKRPRTEGIKREAKKNEEITGRERWKTEHDSVIRFCFCCCCSFCFYAARFQLMVIP